MNGQSEAGATKDLSDYGNARKRLAAFANAEEESAAKASKNYGGSAYASGVKPSSHQHFGPLIVSCDHADLRLTPTGVSVCSHTTREFVATPLTEVPRREVIDEAWAVLREGARAMHDGGWARATTEASLAILISAREDREIVLQWQVPWQQ